METKAKFINLPGMKVHGIKVTEGGYWFVCQAYNKIVEGVNIKGRLLSLHFQRSEVGTSWVALERPLCSLPASYCDKWLHGRRVCMGKGCHVVRQEVTKAREESDLLF